jgi:hypothetical protein
VRSVGLFGYSQFTAKVSVLAIVAGLLGLGMSISTQEPASAAACGSGSSSATYSGGDGVSSSTAFRITTAADLIRLSATSADWTGKFFIQTADIDLGGCEWTPIGTNSPEFTGQYDGGFFAISGLNVVTSAGNPSTAGFFGLASRATFKNIKIIGATVAITTPAEVGILVGRGQSVSIDNVVTSGTITNTHSSTSYTGGIAGLIRTDTTPSTIVNSYSSATVSSSSTDVGGFVGGLFGATLSNSYARGAVTGAGGLGGLSGSTSGGTFTNAFYDEQTSTQPANGLGTAKTTAEMKSLSTFVAWPIVDGWAAYAPNDTPAKIWGICSAVNDGYPFLLWEYTTDPCVAPQSNSGSGSSGGFSAPPQTTVTSSGTNLTVNLNKTRELLLSGSNLNLVTQASVGGKNATINFVASDSGNLVISTLPLLPSGKYTLTLLTPTGLVQGGVEVDIIARITKLRAIEPSGKLSKQVRSVVRKHNLTYASAGTLRCWGVTTSSSAAELALAKQRAEVACAYAKKRNPELDVVASARTGTGKPARNQVVKLRYLK